MSTRCTINFGYDTTPKKGEPRQVEAKIYRHSDGYPDGASGVRACLQRFFEAVEGDTKDTRFDDPTYLAAKFVVWQAGQYAREYDYETNEYKPSKPLNFTGVGVCLTDPDDIEYTYFVLCNDTGRPRVICKKIRG